MNAELQAIKDAWDEVPRDYEGARSLADDYVAAHPEEFSGYISLDVPALAAAVDTFRETGMAEEVQRIETWLLHKYEPQQVGGVYQPQVRVVG